MHRVAAAAPTVTDGRTRSPATGDDELQIVRVFDRRNKAVVIVRVNRNREGQGACPADVDPLVGMRLPNGYVLTLQAVAGGQVRIAALP